MKKLLLSILCLTGLGAIAQVGIEPFDPGTPGTYLGDFSTLFSNTDIVPDVSSFTEEGDIGGSDDFTVDDGATLTSFTGGTGTFCAIVQNAGMTRTLISPEMDFGTATSSPTLSFRYIIDNGASVSAPGFFENSSLEVMYKESSGDSWNTLATYTTVDNTWHDEVIDLSGAADYSTYYLGFRVTTASTGATVANGILAFDEIQVEGTDGPACTDTFSSFDDEGCMSYTVPSGDSTYTMDGTYNDTIPNAEGCDSIMTINVTINTPDLGVTASGATLTADATGVSYQWINCSDSSVIAGETSQNFTATEDGDYAVIIDDGGCIDTSSCTTVSGVGFDENETLSFEMYPNPSDGMLNVQLIDPTKVARIEILSMDGKVIRKITTINKSVVEIDVTELNSGSYMIRLLDQNSGYHTKVFVRK